MFPRLAIKRLAVFRGKEIAYDEAFHDGVNIIHSSTNSCGKSTIVDFIFFVLGGEIKEWKGIASLCNYVFAEVQVNDAVVTLRREISTGPVGIDIFFDTYEKALEGNITQWTAYPLYRRGDSFGFSQVMFKALGIPEAKSDEASNVTMHQLLRILYVDQMTPVQRIFRMQDWDPPIVREVVGNILSGIGGYDLYEKQLSLRVLDKEYSQIAAEYKGMLHIANSQGIDTDFDTIKTKIFDFEQQKNTIYENIRHIPEVDANKQLKENQEGRKKAAEDLAKIRDQYGKFEEDRKTLEFEIADSQVYINFLEDTLKQLGDAAVTSKYLDSLRFHFCPACLSEIKPLDEPDGCHLCRSRLDDHENAARLIQIRLDTQFQLRDTLKLQGERSRDLKILKRKIKILAKKYQSKSQQLEEIATGLYSDRESAAVRLHQQIGYISSQIDALVKDLGIVEKIQELSAIKEKLNSAITALKDDIIRIEFAQKKRREEVYHEVRTNALEVLKLDLPWQKDFEEAKNLDFSFEKDSVSLDGHTNFSASSNVILKNSFMLGLFESSLEDPKFFLPRFMIFDNIEDKGMKEERSQHFQKLIKAVSDGSKTPHQIIFTTSMIEPSLETEEFVVGEKYSPIKKTLRIGVSAQATEIAVGS